MFIWILFLYFNAKFSIHWMNEWMDSGWSFAGSIHVRCSRTLLRSYGYLMQKVQAAWFMWVVYESTGHSNLLCRSRRRHRMTTPMMSLWEMNFFLLPTLFQLPDTHYIANELVLYRFFFSFGPSKQWHDTHTHTLTSWVAGAFWICFWEEKWMSFYKCIKRKMPWRLAWTMLACNRTEHIMDSTKKKMHHVAACLWTEKIASAPSTGLSFQP